MEQVSAEPTDPCSCFHRQIRLFSLDAPFLTFVERRPHTFMKSTALDPIRSVPSRIFTVYRATRRPHNWIPTTQGEGTLNPCFHDNCTGLYVKLKLVIEYTVRGEKAKIIFFFHATKMSAEMERKERIWRGIDSFLEYRPAKRKWWEEENEAQTEHRLR